MRKCLLIFLLMFLPLHFTWAAAAGYCRHESGTGTSTISQHFGHHDHQHQSGAGDTADSGNKQLKKSPSAETQIKTENSDSDCSACHAGCLSAIPSTPALTVACNLGTAVDQYRFQFTTPPVVQLERPQWSSRV